MNDEILKNVLCDERFLPLIEQLTEILRFFKTDQRNETIRNEVIFRQFADKLLTDSERAVYWGLPDSCRLRENSKIISGENLKCGENVHFGENCLIDASGGLEIGSHVSFGANCCLYTHSTIGASLSMNNVTPVRINEHKPVKIGDGCFFGANCVIVAGVKLFDKTVVLPCSYVNKSESQPFSILSGAPAKRVGYISEQGIDIISQLNELNANIWDFRIGRYIEWIDPEYAR
jgi:acetyltransferase-like isoleucine patch superfamily enzyme